MSIKAALLLCQLCTDYNSIAGQTQLFVPSAVLQSKLRCYANFNFLRFQLYANDNYVARQFNLIPLELGNFPIQETLTSNLKKKQTNTSRIDLTKIKNSNPRINYLVLSKKRGKYF